MVVYTTHVFRVGHTKLLPARWAVRHTCTECRAEIPTDQLAAHAATHPGEAEDHCALCGNDHDQHADCPVREVV